VAGSHLRGKKERAMAESHLGPTAQKVLDYLRKNRGIAFTAEDICEGVDCSTTQAHAELEALASEGLVERQSSSGGTATYLVRR
jgi:predicted ArsR family transcriptional regulator